LNAEQLNSARLARWSQNGEARLTLEAAAEWLNTIGFCPYLPMGLTGSAPSASFLEAVVGRPAQTPSAGERSRANELLARMVENSAGVPLKLGSSLGEQPDFVASPEVLRYIYALRGDRNFKVGPSTVGNDKVTPLALHCWQAIQEQGPLNVAALQPVLGRDITEAAIARALQELWNGLYVFPILSTTGKPAKWELLSRRFPEQVSTGASTGQAESQSAMVSLYLHAVVAAAEEEILVFLSSMAPQSKLREVIRGLGSMRQLDIIDIGGRAHVCLQGGLLPEMVVQLSEEQLAASSIEAESANSESVNSKSANSRIGAVKTGVFEGEIEIEREPQPTQRASRSGSYGDSGSTEKFAPKKFVPRKFVARSSESRESAPRRFDIQAAGKGPSSGGSARFSRPRSAGDYPPRPARPARFGADSGDARHSETRPPAPRGLGERAKRWEKSGGRTDTRAGAERPFTPKSGFKSAGFKAGGFKPAGSKPWASKGAPTRDQSAKPWAPRASFGAGAPKRHSGDDEERPKRWSKPGGARDERPAAGRPYAAKSSGFKSSGFKPGGAKPWASKTGAPRAGGRDGEERPKRWEKSGPGAGARPAGGRPYAAKSPGFKPSKFKSEGAKPWVSKGAESRVGSAKSYAARAAGKPTGAKPWAARSTSESVSGDKPKRREKTDDRTDKKPSAKPGAKPFWAKNPRGGKGSVAASRTNRPRGKSGGKKSGKKK
jgi:23S rRNA pseudouridine2605 synthase